MTATSKKTSKKARTTTQRAKPAAVHHYFRLCFVCQPGGSRKTEYYVLGTLAEVKRAAQEDLDSPDGAYHALYYGEEIVLECWQDAKRVAAIDLHPFIRYRLSDRKEEIRFEGKGDTHPLDFERDDPDGTRVEQLTSGEVKARARIDWASVPLPELRGRPLPKKSEATFTFRRERYEMAYGHHDEWDTYLDSYGSPRRTKAKRATSKRSKKAREKKPSAAQRKAEEEIRTETNRGRWKRAIALADALLREAPESEVALESKAIALMALKRLEEAASTFARALSTILRAIDTHGDDAEERLTTSGRLRAYHAAVLAKLGRRDEALAELRRAIAVSDVWRGGGSEGSVDKRWWGAYGDDPELKEILRTRIARW